MLIKCIIVHTYRYFIYWPFSYTTNIYIHILEREREAYHMNMSKLPETQKKVYELE